MRPNSANSGITLTLSIKPGYFFNRKKKIELQKTFNESLSMLNTKSLKNNIMQNYRLLIQVNPAISPKTLHLKIS